MGLDIQALFLYNKNMRRQINQLIKEFNKNKKLNVHNMDRFVFLLIVQLAMRKSNRDHDVKMIGGQEHLVGQEAIELLSTKEYKEMEAKTQKYLQDKLTKENEEKNIISFSTFKNQRKVQYI